MTGQRRATGHTRGRADRVRLSRARSTPAGLAWRFTTTAAIAGGAFLVWGGGAAGDPATQISGEVAGFPVTVRSEQVRPVAHRSTTGAATRGDDGSDSKSSIGASAAAASGRSSAKGESKGTSKPRSSASSSIGRSAAASTSSSRATGESKGKSTPKSKTKAKSKAKSKAEPTSKAETKGKAKGEAKATTSSIGRSAATATRNTGTTHTKAQSVTTRKTTTAAPSTSIGSSAATTARATTTTNSTAKRTAEVRPVSTTTTRTAATSTSIGRSAMAATVARNGTKAKPMSKASRSATAPTSIGRSIATGAAGNLKATPKTKRAMSIGRSAAAALTGGGAKGEPSSSIGTGAGQRAAGLNCFGSPIRCLTTVPVQNPITNRFSPLTTFLTAREERTFLAIHRQQLIDNYDDGSLPMLFRPFSYSCTGVTLRCEALGMTFGGDLGIARYHRYSPGTPADIGYRAYAANRRTEGIESGFAKFVTGAAKTAEGYAPHPVAKAGGALVGGLLSFTESNVLEDQRAMRAVNYASAVAHWRATPGMVDSWRALTVVEQTRNDLVISNKKLGKQMLKSTEDPPIPDKESRIPGKDTPKVPAPVGRGPR